jgi:hypothetical protein
MGKRLFVALSPLDHRIYAGRLLSDGQTWASGKQDVTGFACAAVAQLAIEKDGLEVFGLSGALYEITAKRVEP